MKSKKFVYFLLVALLAIAFFVRVYRLDQLLGFYYDQGRDALVVWRLWHEGKFFLVGPVTGLAGIFLGPAYYYIIAPFYKLSGGSPIFPAVFLAFTTTIAALVLYILGKKFHSPQAGLFAATIFSFSYFLILASRWLSNPTLIILTSVLLIWSLYEVTQGKRIMWIVSFLLLGLALQFESASAVFYLPAFLVFIFWQRRNWPSPKIGVLSALIFLLTLAPQILFDLRHDGILRQAFARELFQQKIFRISFWEVVRLRLPFYFHVFSTKVIPFQDVFSAITLFILSGVYLADRKKIFKSRGVLLTLLIFTASLVGYLFFQGNLGRVYDYYFTGFYLPFVLLFAIGLAQLYKNRRYRFFVILFFIVFFITNGRLIRQLQADTSEPGHVTLGNQLQAIDWIYQDAAGEQFNTDIYVPPIIPYSYDYLFLWQGRERCGENLCGLELEERVPLLYTLYEVDPPHPERLKAWLERQEGIGKVGESVRFGGITVERRSRLQQ